MKVWYPKSIFLLVEKNVLKIKDLYLFNFDYEKMVIDDKPVQKVKFGGKVARNAGEVFVVDGQYYRPAQDCNKNYGNGIVIQRIESVGERFLFSIFGNGSFVESI